MSAIILYVVTATRGISAVGSAFEWHSKGQGFDSPMLHHDHSVQDEPSDLFVYILFRGAFYGLSETENGIKKASAQGR